MIATLNKIEKSFVPFSINIEFENQHEAYDFDTVLRLASIYGSGNTLTVARTLKDLLAGVI